METIYTTIAHRIREQVPAIAWIDIDSGQLDTKEGYRPALDYPAVLIDINFSRCDDMGLSGEQLCEVSIALRLVTQAWSDTAMNSPEEVRQAGLQHYRLARQLNKALQWWEPPGNLGRLRRLSARREKRTDGLQITMLAYQADYLDRESSIEGTQKISGVTPNIMI